MITLVSYAPNEDPDPIREFGADESKDQRKANV